MHKKEDERRARILTEDLVHGRNGSQVRAGDRSRHDEGTWSRGWSRAASVAEQTPQLISPNGLFQLAVESAV